MSDLNKKTSICVYCGSSNGADPAYLQAAHFLGESLNQCELIYGGGNIGLMGAVAQSARKAGAKVTGIMPKLLFDLELHKDAKNSADKLIIVDSMHERKALMAKRSDAFIALPGGIGTLDEVVEILTWAHISLHKKPVILVNIDGYWDPFKELLEHMQTQGFMREATQAKPIFAHSVSHALELLEL